MSESPSSKPDRVVSFDAERANELFNHFTSHANTMKSILAVFRLLTETLRLKPSQFPLFYPKIRSRLSSWKANAIWAKLDKRSGQRTYGKGKIAAGQRVLVIGAGPCGLRAAIEAQLLGAKVVVIEKRDRFSRNNVLHLWPYNIFDLKGIAAKKFYGKFCAGSIDHISIRQLQCILLKVALLLGVEVFENTGFEELIEPRDAETGWKARLSPADHPVSQFEFDVLIGADGKRNTLPGFKRKEFRGKLAIAITVNFINRHSELESMVEEISGVAFIFNQKFFNDLNEAKGIDLENIVYYRDETHYFVMTAKKQSLLNKGVILSNEPDTARLLSPSNINQEALFQFAREAADYATDYKLPKLEFAVNHYGKPDVAMFDFTSMFQAENSCRFIERQGHRLFTCLVGDSLLEPFWPLGTGCARGFFGGFDAIWSLRSLCLGKLNPLQVLAERESIYRLLAQTTPENTCKDYTSYSLDPGSRYITHNKGAVLPFQVIHFYDTDDPEALQGMLKDSSSTETTDNVPKRKRDSSISHSALLSWFQKIAEAYPEELVPRVSNLTTSFQDGRVLCAVIHRYRPYLLEDLDVICTANDPSRANQIAFEILEHDLGVTPVLSGAELANSPSPDALAMLSYLSSVYEVFSRDLPILKRPVPEEEAFVEAVMALNAKNRLNGQRTHRNELPEVAITSIGQLVAGEARKTKKRRSGDHVEDPGNNGKGSSLPDKENIRNKKRMARLLETSSNKGSHKKSNGGGAISSIKKENRYKVIEEQFEGGPKRRPTDSVSKYRENKKPKELRRAIGKIDREDWNVKNIEEKLHLNNDDAEMVSPPGNNSASSKKDKVPRWSKAAFQDKFNIMKDKLENKEGGGGRSKERRKKLTDIDNSLARLQKKLREGSTLETGTRGRNKVSALASELFAKSSKKDDNANAEASLPEKTTKKNSFTAKTGSETCHFCSKRVYVVERMSAEGKFFHRSCFRCDYCNILLRLGSYVYKRDGILGGKFFCIPHYTETYMEKYRYRRKEDEIRDVEARRREGIRRAVSDLWRDKNETKSPVKERLLSSLDIQDRGATPERAEFEASIDLGKGGKESRRISKPAIMDEDEWTDRNFGNSTLGSDVDDGEDTSDDCVSDLDSDSDGNAPRRGGGNNEEECRPLTADEARQLQREWIKKYDPGRHSDSYIEDSSDDESVNYEDGEYESSDDSDSSSSTESSNSSSQKRAPSKVRPPVRKTKQHSESGSSTEEFVSDACLSSDEEGKFEKLSEFYNSELDRSESNTECEFTDSEGRPNPFHKELGPASKPNTHRPIRYSPPKTRNKIMVINPDHVSQVISLDTAYAGVDPKKYQYKTPNISDRLKKQQQVDSVCVNSNISSRRALNLKKNWATGNCGPNTTTNTSSSLPKVNSADVDNRLKSLMDRLSNQQKLLKPAENVAPSKEMQHLLQSSMNLRLSRSEVPGTAAGVPFSHSKPTAAPGSQRTPFISVPPVYKKSDVSEITTTINKPKEEDESSNNESALTPMNTPPQNEDDIVVEEAAASTTTNNNNGDKGADNVIMPDSPPPKEDIHEPSEAGKSRRSSKAGSVGGDPIEEAVAVQEEEENFLDNPPDLEPVIEAINSVELSPQEPPTENVVLFASSDEDEDVVAVEAVNEELLLRSPSKTSSSSTQQSVIESQVMSDNAKESLEGAPATLTDDEITRIYRETNPLEKIAKMNLYKQKQSSVIHDLIMSNSRASSKSPRRTFSSRATAAGCILTSPLPPPPPPPPLESDDLIPNRPVTNINSLDLPLIDDDDDSSEHSPSSSKRPDSKAMLLPATPITDPEKFGIVRHRATSKAEAANSKSAPHTPTRASEKKPSAFSTPEKKKTLMKSISGLFKPRSPSSSEIAVPPSQRASSSLEHESLRFTVSTPSTPPVPLSRDIALFDLAPSASLEGESPFCFSEEPPSQEEMKLMVMKKRVVPPEIIEKILRRRDPTKEAQVKRVRLAQELHRQLEELDVSRRDVESRGVVLERKLRGGESLKKEEEEVGGEDDSMRDWFRLLGEKNDLVRREQEILVQAKQLELEDTSRRLEGELRVILFADKGSKESALREGEIIKELLDLTQAREKLDSMLEKDKKRYIKEDTDMEAQMIAKGLRITPLRKKVSQN